MPENSMPATLPPLELTLIVAATAHDMGIGANGGLPWTGLRKEMAYFARVTKLGGGNVVIMGRKTWDSIPPKFRPLRGRLNVVISRSYAANVPKSPNDGLDSGLDSGPVEASSLENALEYLRRRRAAVEETSESPEGSGAFGRVFVIGGAQIYAAALGLVETRRVLLTRILSDFSCDTFFPIALGAHTTPTAVSPSPSKWVQRTRKDHEKWIGEQLPQGVQTENGTDYEFQMWERLDK